MRKPGGGKSRQLVEKGRIFREKANTDLVDETNPIKDVTALRNLALALNLNPRDTEAARLASNLLLQHVWCPPAAPAVTYQKDALLAVTFVPGGSNNEIFAVGGDGQLLFWNGGRSMSPAPQSLFEKPKPANPQQIVQPGFASFSPDGRWLFIIPPTLASAAKRTAARRASPGSTARTRQCWPRTMQNSDLAMVDAESNVRAHGRGLGNSAASRFPHLQLCLVSGIRPCCPYQYAPG